MRNNVTVPSAKRFVAVADAIRLMLADGSPGDRLPSETDLAQQFSVSRVTVRDALAQLWVEGLLIRRWGSGTFISERRNDQRKVRNIYLDLEGVGSLPNQILRSGHQPELTSFSMSDAEPNGRTAALSGMCPDAPLVQIERCIAIDGTAALVLHDVLPRTINGKAIDVAALNNIHADIPTLVRDTGLRIVKDEAELGAVKAPPGVAAHLGLSSGDPVLHAEQTSMADTGQIVVCSDIYYRTDIFSTILVRTMSE